MSVLLLAAAIPIAFLASVGAGALLARWLR
jgi:hypothetical protein